MSAGAAAMAAASLMLVPAAPAYAATYRSLVTDGPLEQLTISNELNCQLLHSADAQGQMYPSVDYEHAACGTQVAYGGQTYGPADVPGGNAPQAYVPVEQGAATGDGTAATPYRIATKVMAGVLEITQTDTYVVGEEHYLTEVAVRNTGPSGVSVTVYRFGDCYLHEDDQGYGRVVGPGGIACVTHPTDPSPGVLIWMPVSPGSAYFEGSFEGLYGAISAGMPFPSTCDCDALTENAAGLSWTTTLSSGGVQTFSHTTQIAPTGADSIVVPEVVPPPDGPPAPPAGDPSGPFASPAFEPPPPPPTAPTEGETPQAIADACAQRLAGGARWAGTLASSKRSGRLTVRLRPARALRRVRVELRRAVPCATRGRPIVRARRSSVRAKRRTTMKIKLTRPVKPGFYVVLVSGRQRGRTVRASTVLAIR